MENIYLAAIDDNDSGVENPVIIYRLVIADSKEEAEKKVRKIYNRRYVTIGVDITEVIK